MRRETGFSLVELMVAMAIMMLISGAAISALLKMTNAQATIWNRTQMHSGIRGATEVLQQEVGQAGRVTLPTTVTTTSAVTGGTSVTVPVTSSADMFVGEKVALDTGGSQETVQITAFPTATSMTVQAVTTGGSVSSHNSGVPVQVFGGFSAGIVPPTVTNGSTGTRLKMFGDINGDGNMVYIEYYCDTASHNLYRNWTTWNATVKPTSSASNILLSNITDNPGGTACFTYQTQTVSGTPFVIDVAITLTVQTQVIDPETKQYQTETKALLNVSPRNVFNAWEAASLGVTKRIQPTPPNITTYLLP